MKGVLITAGFGLLALVSVGCSSKDSGTANTGGPGGPQMAMMPPQVEPGPFYEGRMVFAKDCARCHRVNGQRIGGGGGRGFGGRRGGFRGGPPGGGPGGPMAGGPGGPGRGPMAGGPGGPGGFRRGGRGGGRPDLGKVGADHPRDWIVSHIRNPQHDKPDSNMPAFGDEKINKKDMDALADYLVSLKGKKAKKPETEASQPKDKTTENSQPKEKAEEHPQGK